MSEFVQTMKDWRRMCQHMGKEYGDNSCDRCRLEGCAAIYEDNGEMDYADVKNKVDAWAAEHPEPVYPTWWEYLEKIFDPEVTKYPNDYRMFGAACEHYRIPADIAQKLGIEPKEGTA